MLDTFLSDTTLFLFLLFPVAMGKNKQIPLKTIIDATSRNDAITRAAHSPTREISYLDFPARVQSLREMFGLILPLSPEVEDALAHFPTVRNSEYMIREFTRFDWTSTGKSPVNARRALGSLQD